MSLRYDTCRLDKHSFTPQGGLRVDGSLTRTGIFEYRNTDGTTRREYRPPEQVFAPAALASFEAAPVTIGHPVSGRVDPSNWKALSVGHVGAPRQDGEFLSAPLLVQDAETIRRIDRKELVEISCGYEVDYDPTPGTTPGGERYDGVQNNVRGNHVALLPPGEARGGRQCTLRLDSQGDEVVHAKISVMTPEQIAALQKELETAKGEAAASKTRADSLTGEVAVLKTQLSTANDPARFNAAVAERVALVDQARQDGVTVDATATPRALRLAVITKRAPGFRGDSLSDDAVNGAYAVILAQPHPTLAQPVLGTREDSTVDPLTAARNAMVSASLKLTEKK